MLLMIVVLFSVFYLFQINRMTYTLCVRREIPEENQPKVFRTINILITILLVSFYIEILYAV
ncbi:hypothetical protein MHB44_18505 [Lysinibacillus sp. FSL H8-0500]|uniref:Uncharacterized protein n=1 Tax=Lysinibacillus macroides TaxID=33935 RepID=A0A0N0CVX3_9BACI|nr:hypothetical protein [Lysinibacillus macroides]KOY82247.1 hypothetical protein ADM90_11480 [Lysinibacillus macroides]QPR68170.1 hypothetical protein I6G82_00375 [Lysinibacillus macroides]